MKYTLTKISYEILKIANQEVPRSIFLKEISKIIKDWLECSELTLLLKLQKSETQFELINSTKNGFDFKIVNLDDLTNHLQEKEIYSLWMSIFKDRFEHSSSFFTDKGTFWTINFGNFAIPYRQKLGITTNNNNDKQNGDYSLLIIPFLYSNERVGLIQLKNVKLEMFSSLGTNLLEEFAQTLSAILINQYTQSLLQERVKELAFLYELAKVTKQRDISLGEMLNQIIKLIPSAWQYPEITSVRITINGTKYSSSNIENETQVLESDIIVDGEKVGVIEIIYSKQCPEIYEGPFFKEERNLLDNIAAEIASIIKQTT
ncbi:hypothetical protein [Plebeiibacterium sediminum]|uniref:GAF domain-containing protein n=1 Tax=Plebeiibacterium sediminum TaxID=2992112 RepID=A0AAE3M9D9_9BACT|nr:hypothetical protein [Plebeiobacterium sediminum]MCW3789488.1 hypothetical protein [Plebeiobacterium sediminum]